LGIEAYFSLRLKMEGKYAARSLLTRRRKSANMRCPPAD
jgi:hypothetical protein